MIKPARSVLAVPLALLALLATACAPAKDSPGSGSSTSAGTAESGTADSSTGGTTAADTGSASGAGPSSSSVGPPSASASSAAATCSPSTLKTKKAGTFTFGTDQPAYEPWFVKNDPTSGQGFESAVAYAVASKLGYDKSAVKWAKVSFNAAIAPGPKTFDADVNEVSITAQRKKFVDFSTGYYDVTQAVITTKGSKIASARTLAELRNVKLGAQVGTTSYAAILSVIRPNSRPAVFNSNDDAIAALKNGQIQGLVVDLPTAFYATGAQLNNGVIVGQLANGQSAPEQFGLVLDKGSSLTSCVSKAVDALRTAR